MKLQEYLQEIQIHLITTHANLFSWFDLSHEIKSYRPSDNGWTILEILEHIALTSHFLMILIDKGVDKALRNVHNLSLQQLKNESKYDLQNFEKIGIHKSFNWNRPEHMEPKGDISELGIKEKLISQLQSCLSHLEELKNGEGLLFKTTMSVNDLGKINVYEYIYFLSKHAERHIQQMEENLEEYKPVS